MPDNVQVAPQTGRSGGVVGAGPAGLTVAKELASYGDEVHIYEALPSGGGTCLIGVPAFRLPRDVIELDVAWVAKHGVEFHYDVEIGRDITLDQLRERHDAVVVAAGCMYPVAMNVPGEERDGVIYGVDFLKRANLGEEQWVGEHVVVVGGGYTAMDSSRTALRLGAKTSTILYRRGPEEMVVDEEEQHETRFEGVKFEFFASPVEVIADESGKVKGMTFQRTKLGPPDASGRRSAEPIPGSEFTVTCDMVIPCTSQAADNNVLGAFGAKLNRHLGVTDTRSILEGGSVSSWRTNPLNGTTPHRADGTPYNSFKSDFSRGYVGYDTRSAIEEGARCLQCNHNINIDGPRCILCGLCADVCPEGVIYMVDKAQVGGDDPEIDLFQAWPRGIAMIIDEERCIRCNLCVERCPTNCITMDRLELERFTPDGKVLLESYKDNVLGQIGQEAGMSVQR